MHQAVGHHDHTLYTRRPTIYDPRPCTKAAGHYDPTPCTKAAGREYRLFRARALRPGNERGCVEPPELERSPQLVTAGRNVRRWCLLTASIPRRLISIYLHLIAILPRHTSLYPAFSHLSPPYHFSAAPRFCISLNVNNLQFCLGEISPKQNHNRHANSHLQKRPVPIM